jgi:MFS family permease
MTRWRMLALLFAARLGLGFQFQTMGSVGEGVAGSFGLDYAAIGLLIGLFMAPGLVLALPAGFSGRFASDRSLAGFGLGMLALGGLVSATAADPGGVGLGRVLSGSGFVFSTLYFAKMIADWFEGHEIATAMSVLIMSWPLGIAIGQIGHAWLAEVHGWRVPFAVASGYCALMAAAVLLLYRSPHGRATPQAARFTMLTPQEWVLIGLAGTAWGTFNAGYIVYLSFGPAVLEAQGMSVLAAASVISVGSWVMIVSGVIWGRIMDRVRSREAVLGLCMAGTIGALILLGLPGAGLAASLIFGLLGTAAGGYVMALAGQAVAPERRAFGMGVFYTIFFAFMAAIPPAAGWIFDWSGDPRMAIMFGAALFLPVLPLAIVFRTMKAAAVVHPLRKRA